MPAVETSCGIRADVTGPVAHLRLDRPPVNAFTEDMFAHLAAVLGDLAGDPKPLLLTGASGIFSAGFDIHRASANGAGPLAAARTCLAAIREHPGPVVAAVEGAAVGVGLLIAVSADILVISRTARLRMPEITLGIVSDAAPLRRFLPEPWVRRMCLLGEMHTAGDMHLDQAGAVLCDAGAAEEVAMSLAASLSTMEPSVLADTKRTLC